MSRRKLPFGITTKINYILIGGGTQGKDKYLGVIPLSEENWSERLARIETKLDEHDKLLQKQQEKNDHQTELNTILKMNIEQMKKFGETLERVDANLTNLNNNQLKLSDRVSDIENTLSEAKKDRKGLIKSIASYLGTALGSLAVAYILYKLGINNNN